MFTVEKIEENYVTLEDRINNKFLEIEKNLLPNNIKEKDIIDFVDNKYVINNELTNKIKKNIRYKFNSLMN